MNPKIRNKLAHTKNAGEQLLELSKDQKNKVLMDLATALKKNVTYILEKNLLDLEVFSKTDPLYDRLLLTEERIVEIADALVELTALEDPVGTVLEARTLPNNLHLEKVRVPFGVVAVIYEARPNVTVDVFALTFKAGNACVLKGSRSAENSNNALVKIIGEVLENNGLSKEVVCLLTLEREETVDLLRADQLIDVVIPRGSHRLISFVRENATVPAIETGAGVVHTIFTESGDLEKGKAIVKNAKTRRPSVCNSLDTLVIHKNRLEDLYALVEDLVQHEVFLFADGDAYSKLDGHYPKALLEPADEAHFGTEFLSLRMSIKTVDSFENAIDHVKKYSSKHSEAIVSESSEEITAFLNRVDAAVVYANASTAFTDGFQFGMGAEIGISTQKLHARGPMALPELTSYKWVVTGDGQVRG